MSLGTQKLLRLVLLHFIDGLARKTVADRRGRGTSRQWVVLLSKLPYLYLHTVTNVYVRD